MKKATKVVEKVTISAKDKKEIVKLHKKGYTCAKIGKAFDITPQSVAAYVAWDTMRS